MRLGTAIFPYYEVTKPRIWYLLVFTAIGGLIAASGPRIHILTLMMVAGAVACGGAGANTLTGYIDRDIDAVMNRTKRRPIPTGRVSPSNALYFGLGLVATSILLAALLNWLAAALMAVGLIDNIVIYSLVLKRRNPSNIILGGISGGMPALIGYAAVKGTISLTAAFMAALVIIWIPTHIWSLAIHSKGDYQRAGIPMLPVVVGEIAAVRWIAGTTLLMVLFSVTPFMLGLFGAVYLVTAIVLGVGIGAMSAWLLMKPTHERAWMVFKATSPYLTIIFAAIMVDTLLR